MVELIRENVRLSLTEKRYEKKKTMDEDMIVPDSKGDIGKIICSTYEAVIENMKAAENKEAVRGFVSYDILYAKQDGSGLEHLEGRYPFDETFETGREAMSSNIKGRAEIEDFTVKVINSRKINIKSLMSVECVGDEINDEEIVVDVNGEDVLYKKENMIFSQIKADSEDTIRIKEEMEIPKNKPNIRNIIWSDVRLKSREYRLMDGEIFIKGDIGVFVIYNAEEDEGVVQWYETGIPFEGRISVGGISPDMFAMTELSLEDTLVSSKADYDGEERIICIEGNVRALIKAYSEEERPVVWDMYSTQNNIEINGCEKKYAQVIMKNSLKARGYNKYEITDTDEKPLQVCYAYGIGHMDEPQLTDEGLMVSGFVNATIIYVSQNDENPITSVECQVPFSQTVSMEEVVQKPDYAVNVCIDQINASMISSDEIEVRVYMGIDVLMFRNIERTFIEDARMTPMSSSELSAFPGIIGYIAPNEATLWDIAKRYKTTVEKIKSVNKITNDTVEKGDKLLLIR